MEYEDLIEQYKAFCGKQSKEFAETIDVVKDFNNDDVQALLQYLSQEDLPNYTYSHS